jgi:lipid II:glycine glycyltransferase (peptidoglycan interpeptide bridge formation enzyme)
MPFTEVNENLKEKWDGFVTNSPKSSFLQSWFWGEFQKSFGRQIHRVGLWENNRFLMTALIIKLNLPFGQNYLYLPQGPVTPSFSPLYKGEIKRGLLKIAELVKKLKEIAVKEKSLFIRFEPLVEKDTPEANDYLTFLRQTGFIKVDKYSPAHSQVQPPDTMILDLTPTEEELLMAMRDSTRHAIHYAERKGIIVEKSEKKEDFEQFLMLWADTVKRKKFIDYPFSYYQKLYDILAKQNFMELFVAKYQGKIIAAVWIVYYGKKGFYYRAASAMEYRNLQGPYLIFWEAIREAKRRNCTEFDFWGIAPNDDPKHPWAGFTRFKRGFRGEKKHWIGAFDLPLNRPLYYLIKSVNFLKPL